MEAQVKFRISPEAIQSVEIDCMGLDWKEPDWDEDNRVHNWKNYATAELIEIWNSLHDYQKKVIAVALDRVASNEHWE